VAVSTLAVEKAQSNAILTDKPPSCLPNAVEAPFMPTSGKTNLCAFPILAILRNMYAWADGSDKRRIFWLRGFAGTGKSTIARTAAQIYCYKKCLGASFFFSCGGGGGDVSHAGKFLTSIALQLASSIPGLYQYICEAVIECSDIATKSLRDQWHVLILNLLLKLDGITSDSSVL
jgi:hypothetical protein